MEEISNVDMERLLSKYPEGEIDLIYTPFSPKLVYMHKGEPLVTVLIGRTGLQIYGHK